MGTLYIKMMAIELLICMLTSGVQLLIIQTFTGGRHGAAEPELHRDGERYGGQELRRHVRREGRPIQNSCNFSIIHATYYIFQTTYPKKYFFVSRYSGNFLKN